MHAGDQSDSSWSARASSCWRRLCFSEPNNGAVVSRRIRASIVVVICILVLAYSLVILQVGGDHLGDDSYMLVGLVLFVCVVSSLMFPLRLLQGRIGENAPYERIPQNNPIMQDHVLGINLNHLRLLMTERDFDANDYEELLRLDEGLHASEGLVQQQIDRFPKSTYKATDSKGKKAPPTCSVCLETLVNGDELRTIPCMHSFHVHCIDTWLRTKPNCPVCMYPVLQADSQM